ncbi:hypothetical protein A2U01_0048253, partial [Trifolium medium]|nr:hypothetical protein [Trifolium medium]
GSAPSCHLYGNLTSLLDRIQLTPPISVVWISLSLLCS